MGSVNTEEKTCWVTLVTKPSYLPGVIILAHSLDQHKSRYPFVVQYTDGLGEDAIAALKDEAERKGRIIPIHVSLLLPRSGTDKMAGTAVAERFRDTYTKLRAFQVFEQGYTRACFLDADMAVFQNPDNVFDTIIPRDWLASTHGCICTPDPTSWKPAAWQKGNCAYTPLTSPDEIANDTVSRPTYALLNGGLFVFYPTEELWTRMMGFFNHTEKLSEYQFPDQDFLADFFRDKWQPVSWKYNCLKTHPYLHPRIWSKEKMVILHYIVDKPWERRNSPEGIGGHKGRDGEMHQWWWDIYSEWLESNTKKCKTVEVMDKLVGQEEPFKEKVPLDFVPGVPEDVKPYAELMEWNSQEK